jgi:hypothetical protein
MTTTAKFIDIDQFLTLFKGVKPAHSGFTALCPGHDDKNRSLSIKLTEDGKILLHCFAGCDINHIVESVGLITADLFLSGDKQGRITETIYHYFDADGKPLYDVCRTVPKGFYQRRPDGNGGYIYDVKGIKPTIYQLPKIIAAVSFQEPLIVIPEGEKDCDNCFRQFGIPATCNSGGAGKWRPEFGDLLKGAQTIAVIADKDEPGRKHVAQVAQSLIGKVKSLKVIEMPGDNVKDLSDWITAGGDEVTFRKLVADSPEYHPTGVPVKELSVMMTVSQFRNHVQSKANGTNNDYIEDILPNSPADYALMVGRSGIGKTNEILHTLFCLASGKNWYGHSVKQCKVGYIAFEGAESKMLDRLEKLCLTYPEADIGDNFRLTRIPAFKMIGDGVKEFDRLVEGLQVVALDPLKYIVAGDYTKPADANVFLTNLKEHAVKMNVLPILVHHIRKPDKRIKIRPEDLMYEVKGAGDYVESANTVLLMELAKQTRGANGKFGTQSAEDRILHFCKVKDSPAELFPLKLRLNRETLLFQQIIDKEYDDENDD